ncbi:MAG TPA: YbaB/EbfC family nucleoid-associated protein [Micromonosporaceae bacterium]|nr:YbaB/EbfC family nucleoid-associated protein [Micromonosporaceae bacterium]
MSEATGAAAGGIAGLGGLLQKLQEQVGRTDELRTQLAELVGRAESPDGLIRVAATPDDPVAEVEIDPRAMRHASEDLANLLQQAVRAAKADLARQTSEVLREQTGEDGPMSLVHNPEAARAKLNQLNEMVESGSRDLNLMFEQMRRQLRL